MGGGGGRGRGLTPEETRKLSDVVSRTIREAGQAKKNVFISFAVEDANQVNLLRGQAKNENSEIEFNDWSLKAPFDSKNAEYIRRGIRERIKQSSVTVVFVSSNSTQSKWVDWEIRESARLGKKVVGMYSGEAPPKNLPAALKEARAKIVPWNHAELSAAIESKK